MCAHVLVAEDDPRQAELVRRYLVADGHEASVVHDGEAALAEARRLHPDLLVLDVMMPGVNGLQVCRAVRAESDVLVMMLTARTTEAELLLGLGVGADDYLTKPYSPRELIARIRTLLRRATRSAAGTPAAALHRVGRIGLDPLRHTVTVDGEPVECTPGEFAILAAMSAQPGRAFTRGQLLHHTRGIDRSSTERTIDAHVMNLRRKTERDPQRPVQILTIYGVGYKLVASGEGA